MLKLGIGSVSTKLPKTIKSIEILKYRNKNN